MQDNSAAIRSNNNPPLNEKTTYRYGNRSFVVEPVFKEEGPETLGDILLRLMKADSEKK